MSRPDQFWLLDAVAAALRADTGLHVDVAVLSIDIGTITAPNSSPIVDGWIVVHSIPGGSHVRSLGNPNQLSEVIVQIDSYGVKYDQAGWVADKVAHTILDVVGADWRVPIEPPAGVAGVRVWNRFVLSPTGIDTTITRSSPVFMKPERFEFGLANT